MLPPSEGEGEEHLVRRSEEKEQRGFYEQQLPGLEECALYRSLQTLVSYRCSLEFTVYRLHCGFLELFPYNALGQVCPCISRKPKSDKLLKSLGVVCKTSPSGEPECLGIFRRQTRGRQFFRQPQGFSSVCQTFLEVQGQTCPALYGKSSRKPQ